MTNGEMMEFPKTFDEFAREYGFYDKEEVYTNGSYLISVFRVNQWLEHVKQLEQEPCYNPDEWCHDCLEYNQDKHCCPRYNKVIRSAVEEMKETNIRTAEWVLLDECSNSGYYCSECHKKLVKEGWSDTVKKIKYCPNCGAKMQEVEDGNK